MDRKPLGIVTDGTYLTKCYSVNELVWFLSLKGYSLWWKDSSVILDNRGVQ